MSTRSAILLPIMDGAAAIGRYHHFDGYPTGLGIELHRLYRESFGEDYLSMVKTLIFAHPSGWSTILGANFVDHVPGFQELAVGEDGKVLDRIPDQPQCYCHGDRAEQSFDPIVCVTEGGASMCDGLSCDPLFIEWAYRLYPQGIEVWGHFSFEGAYRHRKLGKVTWDQVGVAEDMDAFEAANLNPDYDRVIGAQMTKLVEGLGI